MPDECHYDVVGLEPFANFSVDQPLEDLCVAKFHQLDVHRIPFLLPDYLPWCIRDLSVYEYE